MWFFQGLIRLNLPVYHLGTSTLLASLLFCHISFTPALVQMTLMMLKVSRMLLINVVQRPGMYVTFIFQMTCVNSVQSIHLDRLLCFQVYEIRLENSRTREIEGIACLKLAIAAVCLSGPIDVMLGSITPKHEWIRMYVAACWKLLKILTVYYSLYPGLYPYVVAQSFIKTGYRHKPRKISVLLNLQMGARHDVWRHLWLCYEITWVLAEHHLKQHQSKVTTEKHILPWKRHICACPSEKILISFLECYKKIIRESWLLSDQEYW